MSFDPNYGETLLPYDELEYLTAQMRALLGEPVRKGDVYDLEQAVWAQVAASRLTSALRGVLQIDEILTDHFVRELHTELYGPIWTWAGRHRILQTNIGIAPERIAVELRSQIDDLAWRWQHTDDISSRALGVCLHTIVVHIHPFIDGNGRTSRLLADLAFAATQAADEPMEYDWDLNRHRYIQLLRHYDQTRDVQPLVDFVQVRPVDGR